MNLVQRGTSLAGCGLALLLLVYLLVRFPPSEYGFYPACPFHAWTGLLCPGCGGTRAIAALLRGQWAEAWRLNALITSLIPFAALYAWLVFRRAWMGDRMLWPKLPAPVWGAVGALVAAFWVVRNIM